MHTDLCHIYVYAVLASVGLQYFTVFVFHAGKIEDVRVNSIRVVFYCFLRFTEALLQQSRFMYSICGFKIVWYNLCFYFNVSNEIPQ